MKLSEKQFNEVYEEAKAIDAWKQTGKEGAKAFSYGFIGGFVSTMFWGFVIFLIFVSMALGG